MKGKKEKKNYDIFDDPAKSVRDLEKWKGGDKEKGKERENSLKEIVMKSDEKAISDENILNSEPSTERTSNNKEEFKNKVENNLKLRDELIKNAEKKGGDMRQKFRYFDVDGSGEITHNEFENAILRMGITKDGNDVKTLFNKFDENNDGVVSYKEFINAMESEDFSNQRKELEKEARKRYKNHPAKRESLGINMSVIDYNEEKEDKNKDIIFERNKRNDAVIVPDFKRVQELSKSDRKIIRAQNKVLQEVGNKGDCEHQETQKLLEVFRSCQPDEYGYIKPEAFVNGIKTFGGLNDYEANRLLKMADSHNVGEIDFRSFRNVFQRLDHNPKLPIESGRKQGLRIIHDSPAKNESGAFKCPHVIRESDLKSNTEREEYKLRRLILHTLEKKKKHLPRIFSRINESNGNIDVRTKLTFEEIANSLKDLGVSIKADKVKELYGNDNIKEGLTYSQLYKKTSDYFDELSFGNEEMKNNMFMRGEYVGCRKQGNGPASHHESGGFDFSSYDEGPNIKKLKRNKVESDKIITERNKREEKFTGRQNDEYNITNRSVPWKLRWTDKTVPQNKEKRRMLGGPRGYDHGNIISWCVKDTDIMSYRSSIGEISQRSNLTEDMTSRTETNKKEIKKILPPIIPKLKLNNKTDMYL